MWFLTSPPPHTCFRLGAGEWLLVYTCVSARRPRGSCTNTPVCYPSIAVTFVLRHSHSGMPPRLHHRVARLSQHGHLICKKHWFMRTSMCTIVSSSVSGELMCGQNHNTGSFLCLCTCQSLYRRDITVTFVCFMSMHLCETRYSYHIYSCFILHRNCAGVLMYIICVATSGITVCSQFAMSKSTLYVHCKLMLWGNEVNVAGNSNSDNLVYVD